MATTIWVSWQTKQLLDHAHRASKRSFDEIVLEWLEDHLKTPRSLAGAFPELKTKES